MRRALLAIAACLAGTALFAPTASAVDIYSYANGCYALRDSTTGRYVVRDCTRLCGNGRRPRSPAPRRSACRPPRSAATCSTSPTGACPSAGALDPLSPTATPAPAADWRVDRRAAATLRLTNVSTGRHLGVGALGPARPGRLDRPPLDARADPGLRGLSRGGGERHGQAVQGRRARTARVRGFLDDHIHIGAFEFLGGRFHCGRPWSPYGVTVALRDCADHYPNGAGAVSRTSSPPAAPVGTHSPEGWPSFAGWPRDESLTPRGHLLEVDRARLAVGPADHGQRPRREPRALRALPAQAEQLQRDGERVQAGRRHVRPPGLHRRPVRRPRQGLPANRQEPGGGARGDQRRQARDGPRRRGLGGARLRAVQRHAEVHDRRRSTPSSTSSSRSACSRCSRSTSSTTRSADVKFDSGATGVLVNIGNKYATGKFWTADHCDEPDHDNEPDHRRRRDPADQHAVRTGADAAAVRRDSCRSIRPAPLCNPQGPDGARRVPDPAMMPAGMIVETDHMSVKARRQTLSTSSRRPSYHGVISSHSWGDPGSQKRIQQAGWPRSGRSRHEANGFAEEWRKARADRDPRYLFGTGFGSDINGLHSQPVPRPNACAEPGRRTRSAHSTAAP